MRFLLDTQILIWFQLNDPQLPTKIRQLIEDAENDVLISHLSFIEVAIKQAVNRLPELQLKTEELVAASKTDGFTILPTTVDHIAAYRNIPLYDDHRDPFDRLILATALAEGIPIISADEKFTRYRDVVDLIR